MQITPEQMNKGLKIQTNILKWVDSCPSSGTVCYNKTKMANQHESILNSTPPYESFYGVFNKQGH